MLESLFARRIRDNLAWAEAPAGRDVWPEVRTIWSAPDEEFVRRLYETLLGRPPRERDLEQWLRFLAEGGERAELVRVLTRSEEARRAGVDSAWLPRVGSLTAEGCWAELVRLWTEPNEELFVRGLYELLLHRPADKHALNECLAYLAAGNPRVELVRLLSASEAFAKLKLPTSWLRRLAWLTPEGRYAELLRLWKLDDMAFIRGAHELLLLRPPEKGTLADKAARLRGGWSRLELVRNLALSEEARTFGLGESWFEGLLPRLSEQTWAELARLWSLPALPFVQGLFRLLLQRPAEPHELVRYVSCLRARTPRVEVVKALARGEEGSRYVRGLSWLAWLESPRRLRTLLDHAARTGRRAPHPGPEQLDRLRLIPGTEAFVRRAYAEVLGRPPNPAELRKQLRRLRFVPIYTRAFFLRRLLRFRYRYGPPDPDPASPVSSMDAAFGRADRDGEAAEPSQLHGCPPEPSKEHGRPPGPCKLHGRNVEGEGTSHVEGEGTCNVEGEGTGDAQGERT